MGKIGFLGEVSDFRGYFGFKGNCIGAWVTRPERWKGEKDEVNQARRAPKPALVSNIRLIGVEDIVG